MMAALRLAAIPLVADCIRFAQAVSKSRDNGISRLFIVIGFKGRYEFSLGWVDYRLINGVLVKNPDS